MVSQSKYKECTSERERKTQFKSAVRDGKLE